MMSPLIPPDLASSDDGPLLLSVVRRTQEERMTESHYHSRGQLLGAVQGSLSVNADGTLWVAPATYGVWIPPDTEHNLPASHKPLRGWSIYVVKTKCGNLPDKVCILELSGLLREAIGRTALWKNYDLHPAQISLVNVVLDEIRQLRKVALGLPMPADTRILKVAMALSRHPGDGRRIEEWADWAGVSLRTLRRHFTNETGLSFIEWRQRVRLLKSLDMLAAGKQITEISLDLNYQSVSAFIALFRRTFGTTPGIYQKMMHKNPLE